MFAGIDCLRAYLGIVLPSPSRNTHPPLISPAPPWPCFLKLAVQSFLLDSEILGGRMVPRSISGCEHCGISRPKWCSHLSPVGKANPYPALIPAGRTCRLDELRSQSSSVLCLPCSWLHKAGLGGGFVFSRSLVLLLFSRLDTRPSDNPTASWVPASPRCQKHVPISSPLPRGILRGLVHCSTGKLRLAQFGGSEARSWPRPPDVIAIVIKITP